MTKSEAPARSSEFALTDVGNAERLIAEHGRDLRYVPGIGWHAWDGRRWRRDDEGEVVRRMKETIRAVYPELLLVEHREERDALYKHARASERAPRLRDAIWLAQSEQAVIARAEELDDDPFLLCVENGTLDLRTGEIRPHRREDLITKLAPVEYDPEAGCPAWETFLSRVLEGRRELVDFMAQAVGYSLTSVTREQCLFFVHGRGDNGKTTFLNALLALAGDYGLQAEPNLLLAHRGEAHPTGLADLFGVRPVVCVEVEEGRRLAESLVKQLTGGDRIRARRMRQDFFEFAPTHTIFLAANHKPEVRGTDHAIWRRIHLVPFNVQIPKAEQDGRLPEKLLDELPGILAWAVRGCLAWQEGGLAVPDEVRDATAAYRREEDALGDFLEDRCVIGEGCMATVAALGRTYRDWCEESGVPQKDRLSAKGLGARLEERGFPLHRGAGGTRWRLGVGVGGGGVT